MNFTYTKLRALYITIMRIRSAYEVELLDEDHVIVSSKSGRIGLKYKDNQWERD